MNLCLKTWTFCLYFILLFYFHVWIQKRIGNNIRIQIHKAPEHRFNMDPDPHRLQNFNLKNVDRKTWQIQMTEVGILFIVIESVGKILGTPTITQNKEYHKQKYAH